MGGRVDLPTSGYWPSRGSVLGAPDRIAAVERAHALASRCLADQLARLVAEACGAPNALISLVHVQRQFVLGSFGAGRTGVGPAEIAAERSLCEAVVAAGIPIIVGDATEDRRFADTAAVRKHGLSAYVGFPIRDAEDQVVGVLAIGDHRPREWSARQLTVIDDAAQLFTAGLAGEIDRERVTATAGAEPISADTVVRDAIAELIAVGSVDGLTELHSFTDAVLTNLQTGVAACDRNGRLVVFNQALRHMLGVDDTEQADVEPDDWPDALHLFHPDRRPFASDDVPLRRALRGERVRDVDVLVLAPGRRPRVISVNGQPVVDATGDRVGAVITAEDITRRRRAEQLQACELAAAQALADTTDLSTVGGTVLAAIGEFLHWPHAELWLADELSGALVPVARWDQPGRAPIPRLPDVVDSGTGLTDSVWKSGNPVWVPDIASGPLADPVAAGCGLHAALGVPVRGGEKTIGVLAFFSGHAEEPESPLIAVLLGIAAQIGEFSERRRAESYAARLARSEEEYIALVGHELRTPLTSISAYIELLHQSGDEEPLSDVRPLLEVVERNTRLRATIVENLLDLAALDSGETVLELVPTDLATLVREAVDAYQELAEEHGVRLRAELPPDAPLVADRERLRQAVDHLIDNAVRYSPDGGDVEVSLELAGNALALTVADSGIGIPENELELVTGRLHRGTRSAVRKIRGTGLGLAIATTVLARHGGTLTLRSGGERGTTATALLPRQPPAAAQASVRVGREGTAP